jgi:phycobilisome core-membrane linker protein
VELGAVNEMRSLPDIQFRSGQGVSKQREQTKVFKLTTLDPVAVKTLTRAAYRQIFERDVEPYVTRNEFSVLESKLGNGEINLKEFIEGLGTSGLYIKEFYTPYPNTKVIELGTKHFLGRAPSDQAEIRKYNVILASEGLGGFIRAMVNTPEYAQYFGEDTVPYRRFPTLPAATFPNTERLYNQLTKQNSDVVVPSFDPVTSRIDITKMPLMSQAMSDLSQSADVSQQLGRQTTSSVEVSRKPARIHRMHSGMTAPESEAAIAAIYTQVMDLFDAQVPAEFRLVELETQLRNGEISVRAFVKALAGSGQYAQRFCTPYPQAKVVEFLFRHLLGRVPATQAEATQYSEMVSNQGLNAAIALIVDSAEYTRYFGEDVVPYQRFP